MKNPLVPRFPPHRPTKRGAGNHGNRGVGGMTLVSIVPKSKCYMCEESRHKSQLVTIEGTDGEERKVCKECNGRMKVTVLGYDKTSKVIE